MAVRNFNGVNDEVHCSVANLAGEQGYGTVAAIFKRNGTGAYGHFIGGRVSGGSNQWVLGFNAGDAIEWWTTAGSGGQTITSTTTWYLLVARKTSGTTTPRYSLYNFTTATWSHQAASQAIGNAPNPLVAGDRINMSWEGAERFNGRLAVRAKDNAVLWTLDAAGDTAIEAAGLEDSLQKWVDAGFDSIWPFNQAATTTPVEDIVGTADQVQLDNTTVVTGDDPPGFSFALGGGVAIGRVTETGTARSPGKAKTKALGQVTETGTARGLTGTKTKAIGRLVETGSARTFTAAKTKELGRVTETGTVRSLEASKTAALGRVTETGTPRSLAGAKAKEFGRIIETGTVRTFTEPGITLFGRVMETGQPRAFTGSKTKVIGRVTDTGTVRPLLRLTIIGRVTETGTVRTFSKAKVKVLARVSEAGTVRSLSTGASVVIPEVLTLTPVTVSPEGLAAPTGYLALIPLED